MKHLLKAGTVIHNTDTSSGTDEGVVTTDMNGMILSVNSTLIDQFGYSEEELKGKNVAMLVPSHHREKHDHYVSGYLQTKQSQIIGTGHQVDGQKKDGTCFPIDISINDIQLENQCLFVGIIRDITMKQYEENIQKIISEKILSKLGIERIHAATDCFREILQCEHAFCSIYDDQNKNLQLISMNGGSSDFIYDIDNTPCAFLWQKELVYYPKDLFQIFAKDDFLQPGVVEKTGIQSYIATRLYDKNNNYIGHFGAMGIHKMELTQFQIDQMKYISWILGNDYIHYRSL